MEHPVLVVGGGLSGLACALELQAHGVPCLVLEAADDVGGRVRTDEHEGFLLDRGFQVLLTAYPEARRVLDYEALDLRRCYPGALVRKDGRFHRVADPTRRPLDGMRSAFGAIGSLGDKLRILGLRRGSRAADGAVDADVSTLEALRAHGFGDAMIDDFLRPWLGGIFLERELRTPSAWMRFVFRMFSEGRAAVPAAGMGAMPRQLARRLPPDTVRLRTRVTAVDGGGVTLEGGARLEGSAVVVATEAPAAARLLPGLRAPAGRRTSTLWFAAERDPVGEPILVLDAEDRGPVTHLMVLSAVAPAYAPPGAALVAASVPGDAGATPGALVGAARDQLAAWYGDDVRRWRHLRTHRIPFALPDRWGPQDAFHLPAGVHLCGDWCESPSIQGALLSGRRAAEAVLASRGVAV